MKKLLTIVVLSLCFITPSQADDNHKNIVKVRWCQPYKSVHYAFAKNAERIDYCKHKQFSYGEIMNLKIMKINLARTFKGNWKEDYYPLCYKINAATLFSPYKNQKKAGIADQLCKHGGAILLEFDGKNYFYIGKKAEPLPRARDDTRHMDYNLDEITLNKLLKSAKDFRDGRITEIQFDQVKEEILKTL